MVCIGGILVRKFLFGITAFLLFSITVPIPPDRETCGCAPLSPFGCTSFAVYADEILYGMNFDYPEVEIRFSIHDHNAMKVFWMEFQQGEGFGATVGMNSEGLFASCQMLFPERESGTKSNERDVYAWEVFDEALFGFASVAEVNEFISERRVIDWVVTLHDLFADVHGDAMVVEVGDQENVITRIEDDFIVMTNFPNADFSDASYAEVEGVGADRYKLAYEHILNNLETFDVETGLEVLERAVSTADYATLSSMVFDPGTGEVYIALDRDFTRIWKVSIGDETIETHAGFDRFESMKLDASGVLASDLQKMGAGLGFLWGSLVALLVLLGGGGTYLILRRNRAG
jgi:hypothetical protein